MTTGGAFTGAKIALLCGSSVVTLLRDDRPDIPWPGAWDLPGGGREGSEGPVDCVLRETEEEVGLRLDPGSILWRRRFASQTVPGALNWFFAGRIARREVAAIRLGDEGQGWRLMPVAEFLGRADAVPHLRDRLRLVLADGI